MNIHRALKRQAASGAVRRLGRPNTSPPDLVQVISVGQTHAKDSPFRGFGRDFSRWTEFMVRTHGAPPTHREAAVAHEAGHAVTAMTLGATIKKISVTQHATVSGVWGGWCSYQWPTDVKTERVHALRDPKKMTHALLGTLAGIAGEHAAGHGHPASSLDELYEALGICTGVASMRSIDANDLMNHLMSDATNRIIANKYLFAALLMAMDDRETLEAADIAALVDQHGIVPVPLEAAW